jgi:hypothetical protein
MISFVFVDTGLFGIVVAVAVQNTFRLEMHQNDIFFIFKKLFLISAHQNNLKTLKKISKKIKI